MLSGAAGKFHLGRKTEQGWGFSGWKVGDGIIAFDSPRIEQSPSKFLENKTEVPTIHQINQCQFNALLKVKILAVFGL